MYPCIMRPRNVIFIFRSIQIPISTQFSFSIKKTNENAYIVIFVIFEIKKITISFLEIVRILWYKKMVAQGGIEPPTPGFSVLCSTYWATEPHFLLRWRSGRDLNPRSPVWQTDMLTNYTTRPLGCGRRIWTNDLGVMSPASYQLLYPAIYWCFPPCLIILL